MVTTITIDFGQNPPVFLITPNGAGTYGILNAVSFMKEVLMQQVRNEAIEELTASGIEITDASLKDQIQQHINAYNATR